MNREFLLNALFLLFVNLLIKPFYVFGIERTIQERVGAETYGLYATLFSFSFLLFIVNDFGIHYFNNRNIARHPQLVGKYFPSILVLKSLLTCFYLALVFVAALIRGFEPEIYHLLFFIALNHVLISMVAYLRSNISGLGLYRTDSLISTLDKVVLIAICAVLLWGGHGGFEIEWFIHAQNVAWLLTALTAFFIVRKNIRSKLKFRLHWPTLFVIVRKSAPYALAVFLMTAYTRLDIVILEWLLPDGRHEAGIYAAAYRLLDAFNMVGYLFAGLLLPMFSTLLRRAENLENSKNLSNLSQEKEVVSLLQTSLQFIWAGTVTLAVSCFFFRTDLMLWLYPETATPYYGDVLAFIILTLVPFSGIFVYSTLLTANDSLRKMNGLFIAGIVVNLGLNLLLIPSYKAVGAGLAAFATQTVVLFGQMWIAKKELKLPTNLRQILKIALFLAMAIGISWGCTLLPGSGWLLKFGLSITACLLSAFLLRLIRLQMLIDLAKR